MARDPQSGSFNSKVVDEQTKAQAMRAAAPKATPKPPTTNAEMIAQANALIAKLQGNVATTQKSATELTALNPSVMTKAPGETNAQFLARQNAATALARQNAAAENPLLNKAVKPTDAPAGQYYAWIGGTNTGQWQLYNIPGYGTAGAGGSGGGGGGGGIGGDGDGTTTYTAPDGKIFTDLNAYNAYIADLKQQDKTKEGQSAYDLLFEQFNQYGMGALVEPLKQFIQQGLSSSEFTLRLRDTDAYKKRFSANAKRIASGLGALSESEYIQLEDQYQDVMRRYGLPDTYYARGDMGIQEGFNKFLEGDVSPVELEDRISTAQKRVLNANPEVTAALKQFYPDISNGDILAYTLDPKNAIENIKRKVTTAEIGGAALQSGLQTGLSRAEELQAAGVTKDTAQQGFGTIAGGLQRGSQLAAIYGNDAYNQATAETEVFGLAGAQDARKQRQKITGLEKATFGGQTGASSTALSRDRAGAY